MCIILLAYNIHPRYRLILAANRDEFYNRPTAPLAFWSDMPTILAGRDRKGADSPHHPGNGTWLGVTTGGRFAALTNFREPGAADGTASRGGIVSNFLASQQSPAAYLQVMSADASQYNGFNLLVGDEQGLWYYSNRRDDMGVGIKRGGTRKMPSGAAESSSSRGQNHQVRQPGRELAPGIYGLSNHLLDTPWPKVSRGKQIFRQKITTESDPDPEGLFQLLADRYCPPADHWPNTGVGPYIELICAPIFVHSEFYGTRSSSVLLLDYSGRITFMERTFELAGGWPITEKTRRFLIR